MMRIIRTILLALVVDACSQCGHNNLLPPRGFRTWHRYRCETDCQHFHTRCVSSVLIKEKASCMLSRGFLEAGYEYIIIDGCHFAHERDDSGRLILDPLRFPEGGPALVNYLHNLGFKVGLWVYLFEREDQGFAGTFPGLGSHLEEDVEEFIRWKLDYLAVGGVVNSTEEFMNTYGKIRQKLNECHSNMLLECDIPSSWNNDPEGARQASDTCDIYYVTDEKKGYIRDDWHDVLRLSDFFKTHRDSYAQFLKPGQYLNFDQLVGGNWGLSNSQAQAQAALWSVFPSPFFLSHDVCKPDDFDLIAKNTSLIDIRQHLHGELGDGVIYEIKDLEFHFEVWRLKLLSKFDSVLSYVFVILNRDNRGHKDVFCKEVNNLIDDCDNSYNWAFFDVFNDYQMVAQLSCKEELSIQIPPSSVRMLKAVIVNHSLGRLCEINSCIQEEL